MDGMKSSNNEGKMKSYNFSMSVYRKNESVLELLRGVGFCITTDGPDLYLKSLKARTLCVHFVQKPIIFTDLYWSKFLILPEDPILPEYPTAQQKRMRDLCAVAVVKNEDTLLQTMH